MRMGKLTSRWVLVLLGMALVLGPAWQDVRAQAGAPPAESAVSSPERELVERITAAVLKEVEGSEWLKRQIERGIEQYIEKQKAARQAAQTDQSRQLQEKAKHMRPISATRDHIWGNPEAPVSLIEYSDFECPFCKRFHPTPKQIVDESKGTINWVYRHFPLPIHNPGAQKQAEAAECANEVGGNDAFWRYTEAIYTRTTSNGHGFPLERLVPLATELGMGVTAFRACLDSGRHTARVREDLEEGTRIGITGTPATIVRFHPTGEVRVKSGAAPLSEVLAEINKVVANGGSTAAPK